MVGATASQGDGPQESGPDVFVSYSRSDEAQARKLIAILEAEGFTVWWDSMLKAGAVFIRSTEQALEQAQAVVVLWSARSIDSNWVRDEAQSGRERGRLVPVSLDGSLPPLGFRQFQSVDLKQWRGSPAAPEIRSVCDAVRRLVEPGSGAGGATQPATLYRSPAQSALLPRKALVGLGLVLLALVAVLGWRWFAAPAGVEAQSIAILPFDNLSDTADQAYFSEGLSEEMRQVLSQDANLQVAARTSTEQAAGSNTDAGKIAEALGVAYLLDGSVRREGDVVRVSVQLIDGSTGFDVWSEVYERALDDIFAVQTDIADHVAAALQLQVGEGQGPLSARRGGTQSAAAYDAYLRGKSLYDLARDESTDRAAQRQFEAAIAADPEYGAAWAALARVQTLIANSYPSDRPLADLYAEAVASARKAVEVAPDLAASRAALGFVLFNGRLDAVSAEEPFREAYRLGKGDADILQAYATYAARIGDFSAADEAIEQAVRLDPLNAVVRRSQAGIAYAKGDFDAARAATLKALELNPDMGATHRTLGDIAYLQGDFAEALRQYRLEPSGLSRLAGLAWTLPRTGDAAGGAKALAQLRSEYGLNGLYQQAQVLAQTGQGKAALDALDRAFAANDAGLVQLRNDPMFKPLHAEGRFVALLARIGFIEPVPE